MSLVERLKAASRPLYTRWPDCTMRSPEDAALIAEAAAALSRVTVEGLAGVIGVEIATRQDGEPEPSINELAQALVSYINGGKENG